ncbi:MAG: GNAT family N-acetyltransferase [Kordiimonadaceae bacterium]|nr:GNAT family N-acetyltransferase [Kordiimonadaceae bacterium]
MTFEILPYDDKYKQTFYDLNAEWLREFFYIEPWDETILSNPQKHIIDQGGEIFFAVEEGKAIGVVAMKNEGSNRFELTKLGVDKSIRRGGIGRALCQTVIGRFKERGGNSLFLETNTLLENAIRLYWRLGFIEMPNPAGSSYERANYYMEWDATAEPIEWQPK